MNRQWLHIRRPIMLPASRRPEAPTWPLFAGLLVAVWLGFLLYTHTLDLPFFQDDFAHIRWLAGLDNLFEPLVTATGIPAYRPLGEILLKLWHLVLGRHDPAWLRFLNITFHTLNVALVAALATRWDPGRGRYWTAGLAAVLFAALPFSYQAIPWINVFYYPLNNLIQLSMVLVYWRGRVSGSRRLLFVAVFLGALSPFEIEYGLMSSGLLLAVEIILWVQKRQEGIWLAGPLITLGLNVLFLIAWMVVPKSAYEFGPPTLERIYQISFYLLQGLAYVISPLALPLMNGTGLNDLASIAITGLPALVLAITLLTYRRKWGLLIASLLYFSLLNLPSLVTLTFDYVINSPRLLYPAGPAIAWLWAGFFVTLILTIKRRPLRTVAAGFVALAIFVVVAVDVDFIRTRLAHYDIAGDSVYQFGEIARQTPDESRILVANLPSWLTPPRRTFALGNHGIQFIPFYLTVEDVVFAMTGEEQAAEAVQFHNLRQPQPYYYGMHGTIVDWEELRQSLIEAATVYLTHYSPERIDLVRAGRVAARAAGREAFPEQAAALFGNGARLALKDSAVGDDTIELGLLWLTGQRPASDITVFVHLYGPDSQLVAQDDGYPLRGLAPFWLWEEGTVLEDRRLLAWPEDAPPGLYRAGVGLYDPASGERLPAAGMDGAPMPDQVVTLMTVEREAR